MKENEENEDFIPTTDHYISATLLNVKKCDPKKDYHKNYNKTQKNTGGVMMLFMENFEEGNTFYSFISNEHFQNITKHLHEDLWMGMQLLLLNPSIKQEYKNTTVLHLTKPLFAASRVSCLNWQNTLVKTEKPILTNLPELAENQIYGIRYFCFFLITFCCFYIQC